MASATNINLNDAAPAAPAGKVNIKWQAGTARLDPNAPPELVRDVSAYLPLLVGDSGSGGESGAVPAPAAGDAAGGKYLKADGSWTAPPGGGSFTAGGDLSGSSSSQEVIGVQTKLIDGGPTDGCVLVYSSASGKWEPTRMSPAEVALAPGAPGNFTVAHGLGSTPRFALIQMTSSGAIWFQSPTRYDSTNLYLVASDGGVTGNAEVWA